MEPIIYSDLPGTKITLIWPHKFGSLGYYIYRSINDRPLTKLNNTPIYVNFYRDVLTVDPRNAYSYKIVYIDSSSTEHDYTDASIHRQPPGRIVAGSVFPALQYITGLSFNLGKAENCQVLVKPKVGNPCPDCYDSDIQDVTERWCDTCEGTGYLEKYQRFDDVLVRFSNQGTRIESNQLGYELRESIQCQIEDYPLLTREDIVVRPFGERFFVTGDMRRIQLQSMLLKQVFNVQEILVNSQFYSL